MVQDFTQLARVSGTIKLTVSRNIHYLGGSNTQMATAYKSSIHTKNEFLET